MYGVLHTTRDGSERAGHTVCQGRWLLLLLLILTKNNRCIASLTECYYSTAGPRHSPEHRVIDKPCGLYGDYCGGLVPHHMTRASCCAPPIPHWKHTVAWHAARPLTDRFTHCKIACHTAHPPSAASAPGAAAVTAKLLRSTCCTQLAPVMVQPNQHDN